METDSESEGKGEIEIQKERGKEVGEEGWWQTMEREMGKKEEGKMDKERGKRKVREIEKGR